VKFFIPIALAVLGVAFLIYGINSAENAAEARRNKDYSEWLQFSMQHHCGIIRNPSFGNPSTTWQCDGGFQVVR